MKAFKSAALALLVATLGSEGTLLAQTVPPPMPPGGAVAPTPVPVDNNGAGNAPANTNGAANVEPSKEDVEASLSRNLKALDQSIDELLAIPQTPAAFVVGATGEAVARPGTLRDATLQLSSLYDSNGDLKPGFNGEFAPFRVLFEDQSLTEWRKSTSSNQRILDSVRLSLATAKDPTTTVSNAPTLVSMGLRFSIIDDRDYRRNTEFIDAVSKALQTCFPRQVQPTGGGIFEGPGYTQIDSSEACKQAQSEREGASAHEAKLRQSVADARARKEASDAAVVDARRALADAKTDKAGSEAALGKLESLDTAAAAALKPVIEQARADLAKASRVFELAEEAVKKAEAEAATAEADLAAKQQLHQAELATLQGATSKLQTLNSAGDFVQLRRDLETKYLNQGARLELAMATVFTKAGGNGEARFRQGRGWLAYEYAWGKGSIGAAGDLAISANGEKTVLATGGDTLVDGRLGARFNFLTGGVDAALAFGWAALQDQKNVLEYGGTIDLKFTALGAVRTGLLARTPVDGSPTALIAVLAVTGASGESIYKRAYTSPAVAGQ